MSSAEVTHSLAVDNAAHTTLLASRKAALWAVIANAALLEPERVLLSDTSLREDRRQRDVPQNTANLKQCKTWLILHCASWHALHLTTVAQSAADATAEVTHRLRRGTAAELAATAQWARAQFAAWQSLCQNELHSRVSKISGAVRGGRTLRLGATRDGLHGSAATAVREPTQRLAMARLSVIAAVWIKSVRRRLPHAITQHAEAAIGEWLRDTRTPGMSPRTSLAMTPQLQRLGETSRSTRWDNLPTLEHIPLEAALCGNAFRRLEDAAIGKRRRSAAYAPLCELARPQATARESWLDIVHEATTTGRLPRAHAEHLQILQHVGLIPTTRPGAVDPEHLIGAIARMIGAATVADRDGATARTTILRHSFTHAERADISTRWVRMPSQPLLTLLTQTAHQVVFLHLQTRADAALSTRLHGSPPGGYMHQMVLSLEQHQLGGCSAALAAVGRSVAEAAARHVWERSWATVVGGRPVRTTYGGLCCGIDGMWAALTTLDPVNAVHVFGVDSCRTITTVLSAALPSSDIRCCDVRTLAPLSLPLAAAVTVTSGCGLHSRASHGPPRHGRAFTDALQGEVEVHRGARRALLENRRRVDMPLLIILENVEGLAQYNPDTYVAIMGVWLDTPYRLAQARVCAHEHGGAAQMRPRLFIVATRLDVCVRAE